MLKLQQLLAYNPKYPFLKEFDLPFGPYITSINFQSIFINNLTLKSNLNSNASCMHENPLFKCFKVFAPWIWLPKRAFKCIYEQK